MPPAATLVLGLGNPILGDDGAGWHVIERVRARLDAGGTRPAPVELDCAGVAGLSLMERLVGYDRVILVDAMRTGRHPVGHVQRLALTEVGDPTAGHTASAHDASLQTALVLGQSLGAALPREITVVAIETGAADEFTDGLTAAVAAAVPVAAELVLEALGHPAPHGAPALMTG